MALSPHSPLASKLRELNIGQQATVNGTSYVIETVE